MPTLSLMSGRRLALAGCFCLAASGCNILSLAAACGDSIERAIEVEVVDARTGAWIGRGAFGFIEDGSYFDSLRVVGWRGSPPNDTVTTMGAGLGRAGSYTVQVERAGYRGWRSAGVRANEGACGVETKRLRAALNPL